MKELIKNFFHILFWVLTLYNPPVAVCCILIKTHIQGLEIQVLLIKVELQAGSEWWNNH